MQTPIDPPAAEVPFASFDRARPFLGRSEAVVVDLRAPAEFAADHLPGAVNVPLFEDLTRSFVGLLYKQFSPDAAFQEGRAAATERVDGMIQEIAAVTGWDVPPEDLRAQVLAMTSGGIAKMPSELVPTAVSELPEAPVFLHCARGGLRSRSVVALLRWLGLDRAVGLEGGYKSYRQVVMGGLRDWTPPSRVVALRGLTGVGKTLVLREIERLRPCWTLDLEGHAGHRSSLLGMVGLEPVTQKAFESALWARAEAGFADDVMVVEGESRKVGDAIVPGPMWAALRGATNVDITASIPRRVQVLSEDYLSEESALPLLREQLVAVQERLPLDKPKDEGARPDLAGMLDRGEINSLVELLLETYYDPLYRRSEAGKAYACAVEAEDEKAAAREIIDAIESGRLWS